MATYEVIKADDGCTAFTLYYNEGCTEQPSHVMSDWTQRNVPLRLRDGLDYMFINFYEGDRKIAPPDWSVVFTRLGEPFSHAMLGSGEVGMRHAMHKAALTAYYYGLVIVHPRFVGRYFW